jgi:sugar fermentation stimulation protein A
VKFKSRLSEATLLKRHLRFLVEVALPEPVFKAHKIIFCPNLEPLLGCDVLGSRLWYSAANPFSTSHILDTWEITEIDKGHLVCINPEHTKTLVVEAVNRGIIRELHGFYFFKKTVYFGHNNAIHVLVSSHGEQAFLGIESVTFGNAAGTGFFPDSRTKDMKNLYELMAIRQAGYRAILLFCVQNTEIKNVRPANDIHPAYTALLREAQSAGVEILAYRSMITLEGLDLIDRIPVILSENIISS